MDREEVQGRALLLAELESVSRGEIHSYPDYVDDYADYGDVYSDKYADFPEYADKIEG